MKISSCLLFTAALLVFAFAPARASFTVQLDAGELTGANGTAMADGSLLLLLDLGPSGTLSDTLSAGDFVSGTNFVVAAGAFDTYGGTNETTNMLTVSGATSGDTLALRWFPDLSYANFELGTTPAGDDAFGSYTPSVAGSTEGYGDDAWTAVPDGDLISLDFFTSNSDGGGNEAPIQGYADSLITAPEPSTLALFGCGALGVFGLLRKTRGGARLRD
jgi:hypothetical protein